MAFERVASRLETAVSSSQLASGTTEGGMTRQNRADKGQELKTDGITWERRKRRTCATGCKQSQTEWAGTWLCVDIERDTTTRTVGLAVLYLLCAPRVVGFVRSGLDIPAGVSLSPSRRHRSDADPGQSDLGSNLIYCVREAVLSPLF